MNKKIYIAIPCMDKLDVDFVRSLTNLTPVDYTAIDYLEGSLVYASREKLAQRAIAQETDYVLWLDSDMRFDTDLLIDLMNDMDEDHDIVTSLCFRRRPPFTPVIWERLRMGLDGDNDDKEYLDYPEGLFEVEGCGFGAVLMKTKVLEDILKAEKMMFVPMIGYGEDVSFCLRARRLGYKIWCDSRIKVGHVGRVVIDEDSYKAFNQRSNNGIK